MGCRSYTQGQCSSTCKIKAATPSATSSCSRDPMVPSQSQPQSMQHFLVKGYNARCSAIAPGGRPMIRVQPQEVPTG